MRQKSGKFGGRESKLGCILKELGYFGGKALDINVVGEEAQ